MCISRVFGVTWLKLVDKYRNTPIVSVILLLLAGAFMALPFSLSYTVAPEPTKPICCYTSFFDFKMLMFGCANYFPPATVILSALWIILTVIVAFIKKYYGAICFLGIAASLCSLGCVFWLNPKPAVSILISVLMITAVILQFRLWNSTKKQ